MSVWLVYGQVKDRYTLEPRYCHLYFVTMLPGHITLSYPSSNSLNQIALKIDCVDHDILRIRPFVFGSYQCHAPFRSYHTFHKTDRLSRQVKLWCIFRVLWSVSLNFTGSFMVSKFTQSYASSTKGAWHFSVPNYLASFECLIRIILIRK